MSRRFVILLFCLVLFVVSCFKQEEYPLEPIIRFIDFQIVEETGRIIIEFTDGDGDIGLREDEIFSPYNPESYFYHNMYITYWEKDDSEGWKIGTTDSGDTIVFPYRIKPFTNSEKDKPIKGTIEVMLEPLYYNPFSNQNDTIRYSIVLIDRSLNISNELITPEIIREQ